VSRILITVLAFVLFAPVSSADCDIKPRGDRRRRARSTLQ
jgi:hypothetical protein